MRRPLDLPQSDNDDVTRRRWTVNHEDKDNTHLQLATSTRFQNNSELSILNQKKSKISRILCLRVAAYTRSGFYDASLVVCSFLQKAKA